MHLPVKVAKPAEIKKANESGGDGVGWRKECEVKEEETEEGSLSFGSESLGQSASVCAGGAAYPLREYVCL